MAAGDRLIKEWLNGKIIYEDKDKETIVISKDGEFFIRHGNVLVHIMPEVITARIRNRWYVARRRKNNVAMRVTRIVLKRLPRDIVLQITSHYPVLAAM